MSRWLYVFKIPELRNKIFFVFGVLVIFRLLAAIPVPGVDFARVEELFQSNQFLGFVDIFAGGGLSNLSIVMIGLSPFITASIIMQLLTLVVPRLYTLYKEEGEQGRQQFMQYTRMLMVPISLMQAVGFTSLLRSQNVIQQGSNFEVIVSILMIVAGTTILMWLGELITSKNIGNGISMLIFAGIISSIPQQVSQLIVNFDPSKLPLYAGVTVFGLLAIYFVILVTQAQRNIPISYSKQARGNVSNANVSTYLPLRVNQAGIIPIIFGLSLMIFPQTIATFLVGVNNDTVSKAAQVVENLYANPFFYDITYFLLVFGFTFFYTTLIFEPNRIADNLQKQGGFIPGIRPGEQTEQYLQYLSRRIVFIGATSLGLIAVLPRVLDDVTTTDLNITIGGTALLIVVSVVLETMRQIESQIIVRDYDSLR